MDDKVATQVDRNYKKVGNVEEMDGGQIPTESLYTDESSKESFHELMRWTSACHSELVRADVSRQWVQTMLKPPATSAAASIPAEPPSMMESWIPANTVSVGGELLHETMHSALMTVMTERDEAQAQLIAANVLHVHEMENERKKRDFLAEKLKHAEARNKERQQTKPSAREMFIKNELITAHSVSRSVRQLFGQQEPKEEDDVVVAVSDEEHLFRYQEQIMESSESEVMGLCNQLASEISARTSANLEILRLKESRELERRHEKAERKALEEELRRMKEQLWEEQQKVRALQESKK
mmetsp:Transcript_24403/g.56830  ORF Transcript_24403/g.56830 Transcript_24403/m.56830 type:complete len:297 (+) Transcript_24403:885-1775(+)